MAAMHGWERSPAWRDLPLAPCVRTMPDTNRPAGAATPASHPQEEAVDGSPEPDGWRAFIRSVRHRGISSLIMITIVVLVMKDASVEVIVAIAVLMLVAIVLILVARVPPGAS